jgi:hypothetical protein
VQLERVLHEVYLTYDRGVGGGAGVGVRLWAIILLAVTSRPVLGPTQLPFPEDETSGA